MRLLVTSRFISIYTICEFCYGFLTKRIFATMDVSKYRGGRVYVKNPGVKERVKSMSSAKWQSPAECPNVTLRTNSQHVQLSEADLIEAQEGLLTSDFCCLYIFKHLTSWLLSFSFWPFVLILPTSDFLIKLSAFNFRLVSVCFRLLNQTFSV